MCVPSGLPTMKCAAGTGIVAVTAPVPRSIATTAPGDWPVTRAEGTAAYAVALSFAMNMLSEYPGSVIVGTLVDEPAIWAIASVRLSSTLMVLPVGLNTIVRDKSGVTTIMPGWLDSPKRPIVDTETMSCSASTMLITGALAAPLGNSGFETKARNLSPLTLCLLLADLLPPQDTMPTPRTASTIVLPKLFTALGTLKNIRDKN